MDRFATDVHVMSIRNLLRDYRRKQKLTREDVLEILAWLLKEEVRELNRERNNH